MHKKLYKAKKNWVIGLITGLAIITLGANTVSADDDSLNGNINTTQPTAIQQSTAPKQATTNEQRQVTIGMSSNIASTPIRSYNQDNVGYINPNDEEAIYNSQPTHHLSHQSSYNYPESTLNKFARNDNLLKDYGAPTVYEYSSDSENPYAHVKPQQITNIPSTDTDAIHYLNNGVSNSIQFANTQGDPNYEEINKLSQALSYEDYKFLTNDYSRRQSTTDPNYGRFFDGEKPIITPKLVLSTQDLNALYKAAYKNRPIITFDKIVNGHHITSLLQSRIAYFDEIWGLRFDNGWRGYTFMDGKQIAFVDGKHGRQGILRKNSKSFSWKNIVLKYFAQSLAYKQSVAKDSDQKTPYMLVGRNHLPVTDILSSNALENPFSVSPTEFVFAKDGVYTIINGTMINYNPIMVKVPMAFLKPEYQAFYGENADVSKPADKTESNKQVNNNVEDGIFDQQNGDLEYIYDEINKSWKKESRDKYIDYGTDRSNLGEILTSDVKKALTHVAATDSAIPLVESLSRDFLSSVKDYIAQDTMSRFLLRRLDILKDAPSMMGSTVLQGLDIYEAVKSENAKATSPKQRLSNFKKARKAYLDNYKRTMNNEQKGIFDLSGRAALKGVAAVALAAAVATASVILFNMRNIDVVSKKTGVSLKDRWSKKK